MFERPPKPKVFQIGFNRCGTKFLARLFENNGYVAYHWAQGALAEDIAYCKMSGAVPLQSWAKVNLFCRLESTHKPHLPLIEAFRDFKFLQACFPDAIFVLNTRNVDDWIASRLAYSGGAFAQMYAQKVGVQIDQLPDLWRQDWADHIVRCKTHFDGNDRFIQFDLDKDKITNLTDFLSPWYRFRRIPSPKRSVPAKPEKVRRMMARLSQKSQIETQPDPHLINEIARHCIGQQKQLEQAVNPKKMSDIYVEWDGKTVIRDRAGHRAPFRLTTASEKQRFLIPPHMGKLNRAQGCINEVLELGHSGFLRIDMQDARRMGVDGVPAPAAPVLVYNRRQGARNLTLWPLPGYHTPGLETYISEARVDRIPFEAKQDICVWRGNLTGRPNEALAPDLEPRLASNRILTELLRSGTTANRRAELEEQLFGITRFDLTNRLAQSPDFDFGLTLPKKFDAAMADPLLAPHIAMIQDVSWFHQFRYVASLSGHDTGSNFLMAAQSGSVVLKEEDGWELFYTSVFKPWEHYIPLELGGGDIEAKLDWARSNPGKCKRMAQQSTQLCRALAAPANRRAILTRILESLD